ncbi:PD-(D/E)XK nuclease family protein [Patescibacteria group bacterium]|nr:PD-(D/E)XK nuclease family protein [Patescibacteria group bacterium]
MRTSYSALSTYKNCPLKFKYQELDKIKTPRSVEAIFGTIIHSALKKVFERTPLYPSLDEVLDFFGNQWLEKSKNLEEKTIKAYFDEGVSLLKNFYKKNPPWNFNVVELESRFETTIEDKENEENHVLAGIIDRLDKNPQNNTYEIIDYKTAKRMPSQKDLDNDLQLSLYHLGLLKKWPRLKPENIKLSLYFLKHNEKIETARTQESLEKTRQEILNIINEIQNLVKSGKEFIPTPSGLCDWCGYQKMCPMWKHLYSGQSLDNQIASSQIPSLINKYFELKDQNGLNNKQLKALQASICGFMDEEGVDRVFGENGYLTRILSEREVFDAPKAKKILENIGKLSEVISKKQFSTLRATRKKMQKG